MNKVRLLLFSLLVIASLNGTAQNRKDSVAISQLISIKNLLDSLGVEEPFYVLAQSAYETGWFKCKNCTWNNNNMFGFRGLNGKYMKFSSWKKCVIYYSKWQNKRYTIYKDKFPDGTYLNFLKWCKYATAKNYSSHIQVTYDWILAHWPVQNN